MNLNQIIEIPFYNEVKPINESTVMDTPRDSGTTDEILLSAFQDMPRSLVEEFLPSAKVTGATWQWIEPYYNTNKNTVTTLTRNASVFDDTLSEKFTIKISQNTLEDISRMYGFKDQRKIIINQALYFKNIKQNRWLIDIIKNIPNAVKLGEIPDFFDDTKDTSEATKVLITRCIMSLIKDLQLNNCKFGVAGPSELAYNVDLINCKFFPSNELENIYVFPIGDDSISRSALTLFNYKNSVQKMTDPENGNIFYWFSFRQSIAVNPLNDVQSMFRIISLPKIKYPGLAEKDANEGVLKRGTEYKDIRV